MTLTELYNRKRDVFESEIPKEYLNSFLKSMIGSTYTKREINGITENVYFYIDFSFWYIDNKKSILRDEKIKTILNGE